MVHPGGRPRTVSPEPEELEELGKELVAWALEDDKQNPHIIFQQFYSIKKMILRKVWKTIIQRAEFVPYYEQAQSILSSRVMDKEVMDKSFGHRYLRLYDRDLIEEENEQAKYDADLKKNIEHEHQKYLVKLIQYSELTKKTDDSSGNNDPA